MATSGTIEAQKELPHALESERCVLGACLQLPSVLRDVSAFLLPTHFYDRTHQQIYNALLEDLESGIAPDLVTVAQRLHEGKHLEDVGGAYYLSTLTNGTASLSNAEVHARIVQEHYLRRVVILDCAASSARAFNPAADVFEVLEQHEASMAKVRKIVGQAEPESMMAVITAMLDDTSKPLYLHTGFADLDQHVALGPGCVCVIGARPAIGKTTFVINVLTNIAIAGHKTLFISMEMSKAQLAAKVSSAYTGIDSERITKNDLNEAEKDAIAAAMNENAAWLPRILMEHVGSVHAAQVDGIFHRAKERYGCEVVVFDYLQLMEGDGDNGVERMSSISKSIKRAAVSTGLRVIEISQLKRREGAETAPLMSDLREAGQLEADGDVILMLGREKGSSTLQVFIEKNKTGPTGMVELPFDLLTQRIGPAAVPHVPPPLPSNPFRHIDYTHEPGRL